MRKIGQKKREKMAQLPFSSTKMAGSIKAASKGGRGVIIVRLNSKQMPFNWSLCRVAALR
jgi:hypothetical protein